MKPLICVAALASVVGCASGGRTPANSESTAMREGIYEYSASIQGTTVRGRLHVLTDTILVDSESGECGAVTSDANNFRVACRGTTVVTMDQGRALGGALLVFDRGNPRQGAKWVGNFPVQKRRQVCERYEVRQGREVCASMKNETYEELEPRSGPVQVRRVL